MENKDTLFVGVTSFSMGLLPELMSSIKQYMYVRGDTHSIEVQQQQHQQHGWMVQ